MRIGEGFEGGLAVVILAMILDRITQSIGKPKNVRGGKK
jgi:glycine betaine/proline transport system permease protein